MKLHSGDIAKSPGITFDNISQTRVGLYDLTEIIREVFDFMDRRKPSETEIAELRSLAVISIRQEEWAEDIIVNVN